MHQEGKPGALTAQYQLLKMQSLSVDENDPASGVFDSQLDAIFSQIVAAPIVDLVSAVDKLRFAHFCLLEEEDIKEAANLVLQVCQALERRFRDQRTVRRVAARVKSFRFCRVPRCQQHGLITALVVHRPAATCEEAGCP